MIKSVIGGTIVSFLAIAPAFAVAPNCQGQLDAIRGQLADQGGAKAALSAKYEEAQRLCSANKDEEAQALAQQLREELTGVPPTQSGGGASGSSTPSPISGAQPQK